MFVSAAFFKEKEGQTLCTKQGSREFSLSFAASKTFVATILLLIPRWMS
jgi:hypothetical protein